MNELQKTEFDLLKEFISVCDQLGLKYYLLGGTLLGAVRHRGFIPWDDDIDVGMLRADYEVFIAEAQKLLPGHLFVQTFRTDPEYPQCFAKLRNSNTTFIETTSSKKHINHGVYLDIFPLDYFPERPLPARALTFVKTLLSYRLGLEYYTPWQPPATPKQKCFALIARAFFPTMQSVLHTMDRLYRSVGPSSLICNHGGAWGERETAPLAWFGEGVCGVFEGLSVRLPAEYDHWLTKVYGDYMELPPVEKRVVHHYTERINLNKSYLEYR